MRSILAALLILLSWRAVHAQESADLVALDSDERLALNGDAVAEPVIFRLRTADLSGGQGSAGARELPDAAVWEIQIYDFYGRKVAFIQGRGIPPSSAIPWSGSAEDGLRLSDGFYRARFSWLDSRFRVHPGPFISVALLTQPEVPGLR